MRSQLRSSPRRLSLRAWRRRVDRGLRRHQRLAWTLVLLLAAVLAAGAGRLALYVGDDWQEFRRAGSRDRIGYDPPPAAGSPVVEAPPEPGRERPATAFDDAGIPEMSWATEENLRRAAALPARHGDMQTAFELLSLAGAGSADLRKLGEAVLAEVRGALPAAVAQELTALAAYWKGLRPTARAGLYLEDGGAAADRLTAALADGTDAVEVLPLLPVSLRYWFLGNVHVRVAERTQAPAGVIELLLQTQLPGRDLAWKLYWRDRPTGRIFASAHVARFNRAVSQVYVRPAVNEFIARQKGTYQALPKAHRAWYADVVGRTFVDEFLLPGGNAVPRPQAVRLWQGLPPPLRTRWSRHCYDAFVRLSESGLPARVLHANAWLGHLDGDVDTDFLAACVRRHPRWQAALRRFDYAAAPAAVEPALTVLRMPDRRAAVTTVLRRGLDRERAELLDRRFPWPVLARMLKRSRSTPPAIVRARAALAGGLRVQVRPPGERRWEAVPAARMLAAMQYLAKKDARRYAGCRRAIPVFAANRRLTLDKRE